MIECKGAITCAMVDDQADRSDGCMPGTWTGPRDDVGVEDARQAIALTLWMEGFRPDYIVPKPDGTLEVLLDPPYARGQPRQTECLMVSVADLEKIVRDYMAEYIDAQILAKARKHIDEGDKITLEFKIELTPKRPA